MVVGLINTLGNVGRLLVEGDQHGGTASIEAAGPGAGIADPLDHTPHQAVEIHPCVGGDLAGDQAEPSVHYGFAGHPARGILGEHRVQNGVAHLVADLVGVPFRD